MKKYILPLILILLLTFTLVGNCADLFGTYDQRIKLTIDNTKIDATLTWIPITVLLTSTAGEEVFVELDADTDFDKCAFTKSDGTTELYADCEKYDVSGEVAIYHVSLDGWEIASGADTDFYMYYDDDASPNTGKISMSGGTAAQSVYDANFKAVYHMNDVVVNYTTQYEAAVEPDSDGWTLGGTDYASSDGDILTIDTSANDTFICNYYQSPDVNFDNGFYLKTRIAVSGAMAADDHYDIRVYDGTQNEYFQMLIYDTKVKVYHDSTTTDYVLTTTGYIVYEVYIKGTAIYFYADGILKSGAIDVSTAAVSDTVGFGDYSSSTFAIGNMDYFYYVLGVTNDPTKIIDSTSNANHGTKKGTGEPVEATGKVGQGQKGDGNDDYITFPATALSTTDYTIDVVFKADATHARLISPTNDATGAYEFPYIGTNYDTDVQQIARNAAGAYTYPLTGDADWHYTTWIRTSGTITGYENGASQSISTAGSDYDQNGYDFTGTEFMALRFLYDSTYYYSPPSIDEYHISSSARAAAWVKATYESLWDSLLTYGSEETSGVVTANILFTFTEF